MIGLPPYADFLGLTIDGMQDGAPVLVMPFTDTVLGRPGFLHGGAIGGLLEMAAISALQHAFSDDERPRIKPINVTVDYMRGGRDHLTRAVGRISRLGNRVANVEATAWQDDPARPIAAARMNMLLVRERASG
jgi:uncharacterized protein (TIGR00369 family)